MKSSKLIMVVLVFLGFVQANASELEEYVNECSQHAKEAEILNEDLDTYLKECIEIMINSEGRTENNEQVLGNDSENKNSSGLK